MSSYRSVAAVLSFILVVGVLPLSGLAAEDAPPPVFDQRSYADAKQAAEKGGKWFIAKATASWCLPCKQMDRTTWRDDKVVAWLKQHAVAVAFDVDKQKDLAKSLDIQAMPTMIAFKDGKEFDRVVGYQSPEDFLVWLEGIALGRRSIEEYRRQAGARDPAKGEVDVEARLKLAEKLLNDGTYAEATDEFVWLWQHMLEYRESMGGVRVSFMANDMQRLAERASDAKKRFTQLRDETAKRLEGEKIAREDLLDWVALNEVVGEQAATLEWYDRVKDDPRWKALIDSVNYRLVPILIEKQRWAEVGKIYGDAVEDLDRLHDALSHAPKGADDKFRKEVLASRDRFVRVKAGQYYRGLLAASRTEDAQKVAKRARELDSSPAMIEALVEAALNVGEPRAEHLTWLDDAIKQDPKLVSLKEQLSAALVAKQKQSVKP